MLAEPGDVIAAFRARVGRCWMKFIGDALTERLGGLQIRSRGLLRSWNRISEPQGYRHSATIFLQIAYASGEAELEF